MGLLTSAVHGVADAARGSVRAATSGAASVAGGVLEGGASAVGGAADDKAGENARKGCRQ